MNILAIIQARMGSTRFPGKILKKINDKLVLDYVIERLRLSKMLNDIILATTISERDNVIEQYAIKKNVTYFRGNEEDVLSRYYYAAKKYGGDIIVRITSDCPLIDPVIVDQVIKKHIELKVDYTSNSTESTYPKGLDVEVFNYPVLEEAFKNATQKYEKEHVTPYILEHPQRFKLLNIEAEGKFRRPDIRITLDTKEDFELISKIISNFKAIDFSTEAIIDYINEYPKLLEINKNVKQKGRMD